MLSKKNKYKNFISLSMKHTLSFERVNNNFILIKLKKILLNWNIVFFKLINLRKNKIKLLKVKLNKNSFLFFFPFFKVINVFFFFNKNLVEKKINIESIAFNGYFLNFNFLQLNNYTNIFFSKNFIFYFFFLFLNLWMKILFFFLCKLLVHLRFNFLTLKLNKIDV